ncbi:MAG: NAD(P)/FAD-dependent oxidoreductase [Gammaproteobacteria bacterium]|nr:NAD(P)/FAD-dependent oxidoreductase [Gammaproteobacteria bacterium]
MRYVVIGAGPAGVTAAETLREQDPEGEVIIVGGEGEPAYSRMAIPYLLAGDIGELGTYLRQQDDYFQQRGISIVQDSVTTVDTTGSELNLASGDTLGFDRLLIATGSKPVSPPIDGLDQPGVHHCWTLEDARHISRLATPGSRVVLMGAGFIGCIIMEALKARGVELTVIEMGDRMVPRMMDETAGNLIKHWCQKRGVDVHTSTRVTQVIENPDGAGFKLACEPQLELQADLIVVATGVRPNLDFLQGSDISLQQGVVVNDRQQTTVPTIYAAGDCCETTDMFSGESVVNAIQPVAVETGRIAALNMVGGTVSYQGSLGMNILDTLGLISISYGQWMGVAGGDAAELLDADGYRYIKLQFDQEQLIGAITLGRTDHVGALRGLIESRIPLGKWKQQLLDDPGRIMEAWLGAVHNTL